ncbi:MAG: Gfo/Idh/MocA family protein [Gammaproteobacteria bacterium]
MLRDEPKAKVRVGLIGAGFMGKCHANAFRSAPGIFDLPVAPVLDLLADVDEATACRSAAALGFERSTGDWRTLTGDPSVDIVAITAPNSLHAQMALAAIAGGKVVYCEKPLSVDAASARTMRDAAVAAGACTMVGFNFLRNPMLKLAREIVGGGEIGEVVAFRGIHAENYMANPATPHSFRTDPAGGGGALCDIGSHIISIARYLLGPIAAVNGMTTTVYPSRPQAQGSDVLTPVVVDDRAVFLARFESGVTGTIEADWAATGRRMQLAFEITGTKGAIAFTQERMNELRLHCLAGAEARHGFTRIESGPEHPPYGNFCPAGGHQLGFNDLKVIEVAELIDALVNGTSVNCDFEEAYQVQRTVDAVKLSAREQSWIDIASI